MGSQAVDPKRPGRYGKIGLPVWIAIRAYVGASTTKAASANRIEEDSLRRRSARSPDMRSLKMRSINTAAAKKSPRYLTPAAVPAKAAARNSQARSSVCRKVQAAKSAPVTKSARSGST
jgi:hypothetical protein